MRFICWALAALTLAGPVAAQQTRQLAVPAGKGWQHAATGLILPARLDGLARTGLTDSTTTEADVAAQFGDLQATVATVYIFHPAVGDVSLWFDRADTQVRANRQLGQPTSVSAAPIAFAPPAGGPASALRRTYRPTDGAFTATGLAVMPLEEWLVSVRMSSRTLDPAALDAALLRLVGAMRWPSIAGTPALAARPIAACSTPLRTRRAKLVKPGMADLLMSSMSSMLSAAPSRPAPAAARPDWCRAAEGTSAYGVYRAGDGIGYTLALADAGRVIAVTPSIMSQIDPKAKPNVTVALLDVDGGVRSYPSFDALPDPAQVMDLVSKSRPAAETSRDGRTVDITLPGS